MEIGKCIAIASQSNSDNFIFNFCYYFLEKENCNSWKIDNFMGSNRENGQFGRNIQNKCIEVLYNTCKNN